MSGNTPTAGAFGQGTADAAAGRHRPNEIYDIKCELGSGTFSKVMKGVRKRTGEGFAVKTINTKEVPPAEISREIGMMRLLTHENIVRCHNVQLAGEFVNIIVDQFCGGDLIDGMHQHFKTHGDIPSDQLARITRQMVAAVSHVHSFHIVHRDIKGENFLFDRKDIADPRCHIALSDFGSAIRLSPGERLSDQAGTRAYWSPEVWRRSYGQECDIWAVGVTTYVLMMGALPEFEREEGDSSEGGNYGDIKLHPAIPVLCSSFLREAMQKDDNVRITAAQALQHPWLARHASPVTSLPEDDPVMQLLPAARGAAIGCAAFLGQMVTAAGAVSCSLLLCGLEMLTGSDQGTASRGTETKDSDKEQDHEEEQQQLQESSLTSSAAT